MSEDSPSRGGALQSQDAVGFAVRQMAHHTFASPHSRTTTGQHLAEGHFENFPQGVDADSSGHGAGRLDFPQAVPQRPSPSGVPAHGDGLERDRTPQSALPLGRSARRGTRPGKTRIRRPEKEIPLGMLSQKERQREKKQENKRWTALPVCRQSCGDFLLHAVQARPRLKETNAKNSPAFGLERQPYYPTTHHHARLTCLGRAA